MTGRSEILFGFSSLVPSLPFLSFPLSSSVFVSSPAFFSIFLFFIYFFHIAVFFSVLSFCIFACLFYHVFIFYLYFFLVSGRVLGKFSSLFVCILESTPSFLG